MRKSRQVMIFHANPEAVKWKDLVRPSAFYAPPTNPFSSPFLRYFLLPALYVVFYFRVLFEIRLLLSYSTQPAVCILRVSIMILYSSQLLVSSKKEGLDPPKSCPKLSSCPSRGAETANERVVGNKRGADIACLLPPTAAQHQNISSVTCFLPSFESS